MLHPERIWATKNALYLSWYKANANGYVYKLVATDLDSAAAKAMAKEIRTKRRTFLSLALSGGETKEMPKGGKLLEEWFHN